MEHDVVTERREPLLQIRAIAFLYLKVVQDPADGRAAPAQFLVQVTSRVDQLGIDEIAHVTGQSVPGRMPCAGRYLVGHHV